MTEIALVLLLVSGCGASQKIETPSEKTPQPSENNDSILGKNPKPSDVSEEQESQRPPMIELTYGSLEKTKQTDSILYQRRQDVAFNNSFLIPEGMQKQYLTPQVIQYRYKGGKNDNLQVVIATNQANNMTPEGLESSFETVLFEDIVLEVGKGNYKKVMTYDRTTTYSETRDEKQPVYINRSPLMGYEESYQSTIFKNQTQGFKRLFVTPDNDSLRFEDLHFSTNEYAPYYSLHYLNVGNSGYLVLVMSNTTSPKLQQRVKEVGAVIASSFGPLDVSSLVGHTTHLNQNLETENYTYAIPEIFNQSKILPNKATLFSINSPSEDWLESFSLLVKEYPWTTPIENSEAFMKNKGFQKDLLSAVFKQPLDAMTEKLSKYQFSPASIDTVTTTQTVTTHGYRQYLAVYPKNKHADKLIFRKQPTSFYEIYVTVNPENQTYLLTALISDIHPSIQKTTEDLAKKIQSSIKKK